MKTVAVLLFVALAFACVFAEEKVKKDVFGYYGGYYPTAYSGYYPTAYSGFARSAYSALPYSAGYYGNYFY